MHTNKEFKEKQSMSLISLDVEKAYDTTRKHRIILKLGFIAIFLKTRTYFQVKINNILSDIYTQKNGIFQASSISVTLFLIAINDVSKCISNSIKYTLFADDVNIFLKKQTNKDNTGNVISNNKQYLKFDKPNRFQILDK